MDERTFDVVVIGAGPASKLLAARLAERGRAVAVAVVGAVPTQALLKSMAPFPTRSEIWLKPLERYDAEHRTGALAAAA